MRHRRDDWSRTRVGRRPISSFARQRPSTARMGTSRSPMSLRSRAVFEGSAIGGHRWISSRRFRFCRLRSRPISAPKARARRSPGARGRAQRQRFLSPLRRDCDASDQRAAGTSSGGIKVWVPLSTASFDTGVAAIGANGAGLLWVEDALTDNAGEARSPWALVRASRPSLENRLHRLLQALGEGHPLAGGRTATAIAGRMDQDCTLFSLGDGAEEALLVDLW